MASNPETSPAAFLGGELRRTRIAAGYSSQDSLAVHLGFDRTVIVKAETGSRPPTADVLAAWCEACGLDAEFYARLGTLARNGDGPIPTWFEDWLDAEREAVALSIWSPTLIPGLFQTAAYARALLMAQQIDTSDENIDALVKARLERQENLDRASPPDVVCVVDELVLRRLIGSPQVMQDALAHFADMAQRPNIVVQVVPSGIGANAGLGGAFDIAYGEGHPDTLRMEGVEDQTVHSRSLVRKAAVTFNRVRGDAMPRGASLNLINEVTETWKQ